MNEHATLRDPNPRLVLSQEPPLAGPHESLALGAYESPEQLVSDRIDEIRLRVEAVHAGTDMAAAAAADAVIAHRMSLSDRGVDPVARLAASTGLSTTERRVLWLLIGHELSAELRHLVRRLNSESVPDPTADTIRRVAYGERARGETAWHELSDGGALRGSGLIERTDGQGTVPAHRQTWAVSARVMASLYGIAALDRELEHLATVSTSHPDLARLELAPGVLDRLITACERSRLVILHGTASSGRRSALLGILARRGSRALEIEGRAIAKTREQARDQLGRLARECALLGLTPIVKDIDALAASGDTPDRLEVLEREFAGTVFATSTTTIAHKWARSVDYVELPALSGAQRAQLWHRVLPVQVDADAMATTYPLAPGLIHAAGVQLRSRAVAGPADVAEVLSGLLDNRLAGLAKRVTVTQTWDDVVLPQDQVAGLVELISRVRERRRVYEEWGFGAKVGRGIGMAALLSGPPGTGKTMTAGLVAKDLGLHLYQVDVSKIVSKWIGETEKNLAALFDAAEAGHAILLFDEADALFGKRTDVKSSNDRHANQEVNYLLQRLESFTGILILTTNHETAMDEAFRRRLAVHVRFPLPEEDERLRLWAALLPKDAPVEGDLGLERLAERYEMSGGYIRNAVVRAAFIAAAEGRAIHNGYLRYAAQVEYEAMGKIAPRE